MAKIEREITHHMSLDKAKSVAENLVAKLQGSFGSLISEVNWNADKTAASVKGKGFSGNFEVNDTVAKIVIELGLLTSPFKSKVEEKVDEYAKDFEADKDSEKA